jgi:hypothetical protein
MLKSPLAFMCMPAVSAAIGLLPNLAFAQTTTTGAITINTGSQATQLVDKVHKSVSHSYLSDHPFWVNLDECRQGWQYQISVSTIGTGSANMEVWAASAGGDCSTVANRYTSPLCWRVGYFGVTEGTFPYYIPVQRIVGQHTFVQNSDPVSVGTTVPEGKLEDCDATASSGTIPEAGAPITLFFYIFGGTVSGAPAYSQTWGDSGYDLIGPTAPGTVGVRSAESELYMNWSQVLDSDLAGYRLYCEPCQTPDASADICAQYANTDANVANCVTPSTDLIPGCLPADNFLHGSVSDKLATSGIATNLNNGTPYGCAIATFDTRRNSGTLSSLQTGRPWPVNDFFSTYRAAGGKGGGGFCSIGQRSSGIGMLIPLASLGLLALRRGRCWPRKSKRTSA